MKFIYTCLLLVFFLPRSEARLLQIIHTNDLHSYFEGDESGLSNYSKLRTVIKQLRASAKKKGIPILQLDAGDWGEGTSFYLADDGKDSVRALELLGTEVATIGNHDHQLGGSNLARKLREARVSTRFTAANLKPSPEMNLEGVVSPYVDLKRGGIRVRVIGLTTDEKFYEYSFLPGKISSPFEAGEAQGRLGREEGRELIIALTHLGVGADENLGRSSSSIDVIVGGHSHTKLEDIDWVTNRRGKKVPIVQAHAHGLAVGSLFLDVSDGGDVKVVSYELHQVQGPIAPDPEMQSFVQEARLRRDTNLMLPWDQVVGETKVPMTGSVNGRSVLRSSCWGRHVATAARRAVKAAVGVHVHHFEGVYKKPGIIRFADLVDNLPHLRKFGDQGWEIATITVPGIKLRALMLWISRKGYGVSFSGLGYKQVVDEKAIYKVAFPAEVVLAIKASFPSFRQYLTNLKFTGKFYWPVMTDYLREHSPLSCPKVRSRSQEDATRLISVDD